MDRYRRSYSGYELHEYAFPKKRRYGVMRFLWDLFMVVMTHGFWLVWIFVREMRRR